MTLLLRQWLREADGLARNSWRLMSGVFSGSSPASESENGDSAPSIASDRMIAQNPPTRFRPLCASYASSGPRRLWTILLSLLGIAVATIACGDSPRAWSPCYKLAVPAYADPADANYWHSLSANGGRPEFVIVNPDNGPGEVENARYKDLIQAVQGRGSTAYGYVKTGYGQRAASAVLRDIARYYDWYQVRDVFLDEASESTHDLATYRRYTAAVHAYHGAAVLNPGVVPPTEYFAMSDAVVTFEGGADDLRRKPERRLPPRYRHRGWVLVVGVSRNGLDQTLRLASRYGDGAIFVTDQAEPNPWARLPSYWDELLASTVMGCRPLVSRPAAMSRAASAFLWN